MMDPLETRADGRMSDLIEQGRAISLSGGAAQAWVFLTYHGIPVAQAAEILAGGYRPPPATLYHQPCPQPDCGIE